MKNLEISLQESISEATGEAFSVEHSRPLAGGDINSALLLEGKGKRYFVKLNRASLIDMFAAEAEGLAELAAAHALRVPGVICWGADSEQAWLVLEYIEFGRGDSDALFGEQLAALHRVSAETFGWHRDNTIGTTLQPNAASNDWIAFLREQRLGFQLELAASHGASSRLVDSGEELLGVLPAFFSTYSPSPSLLHGDLWGGNRATDSTGRPVIFDPAVYHGDRESDLAMTELFGGFGSEFYAAYDSAWPLDAGYALRKRLYQLYHVLNHFNLFGGGYAAQAERLIRTLLSEIR